MYVNLLNVIHAKGISMSSLSKEVGCTCANLNRLANNKTKSIHFDLLQKLCDVLNCGVADILVLDDSEREQ